MDLLLHFQVKHLNPDGNAQGSPKCNSTATTHIDVPIPRANYHDGFQRENCMIQPTCELAHSLNDVQVYSNGCSEYSWHPQYDWNYLNGSGRRNIEDVAESDEEEDYDKDALCDVDRSSICLNTFPKAPVPRDATDSVFTAPMAIQRTTPYKSTLV